MVTSKTTATKTQVQVSVETIAPERSAELLATNTNNRPMNFNALRILMEAMGKGQWVNDGNPIRISRDNVLLDGQHRLRAALDTDTTFESVIVTNLDPACFSSIDGGKPRTATDAAHVAHITAPGRKTAFARRALLWESPRGIGSNASFTNSDVVGWLSENLEAVELMYSYARPSIAATGIRQGGTYDLLFWLFSKVSADKAVQFFEDLASGADLPEGSPILALQKSLNNTVKRYEERANGTVVERTISAMSSNGPGRLRLVSLVIKAWNMWLSGETVTMTSGSVQALREPKVIPDIAGEAAA